MIVGTAPAIFAICCWTTRISAPAESHRATTCEGRGLASMTLGVSPHCLGKVFMRRIFSWVSVFGALIINEVGESVGLTRISTLKIRSRSTFRRKRPIRLLSLSNRARCWSGTSVMIGSSCDSKMSVSSQLEIVPFK